MTRASRLPAAFLAVAGLLLTGGPVFGFALLDKPAEPVQGKQAKSQRTKNISGLGLVGEKIKKNAKHEFHHDGKFSATVDVERGKIAGIGVRHLDRGDVAVTKYKTTKRMGRVPAGGVYFTSLGLSQVTPVRATWIGYAYIDDDGDQVLYWFPSDMILDGDAGAVEYDLAD